MAIVSFLSYLYDCDMNPVPEAHLTSSYIHPFMHGLLSAKKPARVAHCSDVVPEEFDDAVSRPDYKIDVYAARGQRFSYTNAYGEIKKSRNVSATLLVKDLYRLCIFSKEAIDRYSLRNVLSFQGIVNTVTFYTTQLEYPYGLVSALYWLVLAILASVSFILVSISFLIHHHRIGTSESQQPSDMHPRNRLHRRG